MPHFFINSDQIENNTVTISDKENYFHIARSLRARTGENLLLIDENKIQYETTIELITNDKIKAKINKSYSSERFLDFELYLAQSPLRSDAQNLLIEKATELGVRGVFPVKTDNCALNNDMIDKKISKFFVTNLIISVIIWLAFCAGLRCSKLAFCPSDNTTHVQSHILFVKTSLPTTASFNVQG